VEYFVRGADAVRSAETWPRPACAIVTWHLSAENPAAVTSLQRRMLSAPDASGEEKTSYKLS